ncbi:AAA family ATPase [Sphaerisporangium sp. NPDC005289]|uniref:helix-turn-helix transcriptional regulator n=1 Tax=Sphaerisporangium sp. NPDC005289 TaxID=3155247 RepID=UPI0033A0EA75
MSPASLPARVAVLRGRDAEQDAVRRLLDRARTGSGGAMLFAGGPGMGKTALLDHAAGQARGFLVLRTRGAESEHGLPHAALHRLLRPLGDPGPHLPEPQAALLRATLHLPPASRPLSATGPRAPGATASDGPTPAAAAGGRPSAARRRARTAAAPFSPVAPTQEAGDALGPAVAVLEWLASLAARGPVLVCVDDLHHLDAASHDLLLFAARRLAAEPVAFLFTADRPPGHGAALDDEVPVRVLGPLDPAAARQMLDDLAPAGLGEDLRASLERLAHGVPLALAELTGSLTPGRLAGTHAPPVSVPPGGRLWRAHTRRLAALPEATRALLLLVAADPDLDIPTLVRAAAPRHGDAAPSEAGERYGGVPPDAGRGHGGGVSPGHVLDLLEPAEVAGVLTAEGDRYAFAEPVMGPVVYAAASPAARRAAHRLLAGVLHHDHQRLRRAWHRAAALDGSVDELAAELAEAAQAAGPHAGHPEPYLALERAAELTERGEVKAARLAAAAHHASISGHPQRARALLARLSPLTVPAEMRGQAELLRGNLELLGGETGSAHDRFLAAAGWLLDRDRSLGVRALVRAAEAGYFAGDHQRFLAIARRAAVLRRPDERPATRLMFEFLEGMAATLRGRHAEAAEPLRRVLLLAPHVHSTAMLVWAGSAGLLLGDDANALALATRAVESARGRGGASALPQLLSAVINAELWLGRYGSVTRHAIEGLRLAQETGQHNTAGQHLAWLALAAAVQGDKETCRTRAAAALEVADAHGLGVAAALGNWALAHLDLSRGRAADAAGRLRAELRNGHVVVRVMATPTFIEAAARTGERQDAMAALDVLDRWAGSTRNPDRLALAARCHALLAEPGASEELFRHALDLHHRGSCEFETARTELLFGGALRRDRRPGAAREHLHSALDAFERFGARLWAAQARAELRAAGQAVPPPSTPASRPFSHLPEGERQADRQAQIARLTAQQEQIARMVAEGATNREVAARLVISPRTVDHHLRNIFAQLGIRSRVDLARLLS